MEGLVGDMNYVPPDHSVAGKQPDAVPTVAKGCGVFIAACGCGLKPEVDILLRTVGPTIPAAVLSIGKPDGNHGKYCNYQFDFCL
ncbi:hypothetical protein GF1_31610 [Desulfolithobacter dissulfuricans]|uniref:Uncharacterized protein n=1 Tax=Desulfolithobacter dissulfuricans TaxID=2795293 RepID=A0A915U4A3_9BACT|nr:hypothetical protein GF1_31610 [Desulfolithobacter dissulfuricans]